MGRQKAPIEPNDVIFAQSYLINRCKEDDEYIQRGSITTRMFLVWLEDKLIDDELNEFELEVASESLTKRCLSALTDEQWTRMKNTIRQDRRMESTTLISAKLTPAAHKVLLKVIKKHSGKKQFTLSDAILLLNREASKNPGLQ